MQKCVRALFSLYMEEEMEDEWICTDPSCNQFKKQINDHTWLFKENRLINLITRETEVYESEIDLEDYNWWDIVDACKAFGYSNKRVDDWLNTGEELDLIAECLFELKND